MKTKLLLVIFGAVFFLSVIQLVISYNLATSGEKVRLLELKTTLLEKENMALNAEINRNGSLSRITSEAQKFGLVKATQVLHLTPEIPVAMGR